MTTRGFGQHIPDILDCLAQLSNDEVPTPPKLVQAMLDQLPDEVWSQPDYRWLDPVSKSGIFLREIATRLFDGLADWEPNFIKRREHIFRNMLFGTSVTEMTGIIARRSVYCTTDASSPHSVVRFDDSQGNIPFIRSRHDFGTNDRCRLCNAPVDLERGDSRENFAHAFIHGTYPTKEMSTMKFDVIVGNPPYHLEDGGFGSSSTTLYHLFVEQARSLNPRYLTMIIPSRWFSGGKGLDKFRDALLKDDRIRSITDYLSAAEAFPGIGLKGGVSYFLWDRENRGPCTVTTLYNDWPVSVATRPLVEPGADVFVRFNEGVSIVKKVVAVETGQSESLELPPAKRFDELVSPRKPFGLTTTFKGALSPVKGGVKVYRNGGIGYTERDSFSAGGHLVDSWKIYVGRAAPGTGNKDTYPHKIISTPFKGEPGSISSETYLCIGPFATEDEADSALSYLQTRLARFLILLRKPSQDTSRRVYGFVPAQTWDRAWTDADLYEKYDLSADEITFIEKVVRPMGDTEDKA